MGSQKGQFGDAGYKELTAASGAYTDKRVYAIQAVDNASATVTIVNAQGDNSTGLVIGSGQVIFPTATSVTVTDGKVLAYFEGS